MIWRAGASTCFFKLDSLRRRSQWNLFFTARKIVVSLSVVSEKLAPGGSQRK